LPDAPGFHACFTSAGGIGFLSRSVFAAFQQRNHITNERLLLKPGPPAASVKTAIRHAENELARRAKKRAKTMDRLRG
jgi:hypothetical protein